VAGPDRLQDLLVQHALTGVDFVYVEPGQTVLRVYFHHDPAAVVPSLVDLAQEDVRITSQADASPGGAVQITGIAFPPPPPGTRPYLQITVAAPGDFARYVLSIADPRIDPYFNDVAFSFKAGCDSDLDCAPVPTACPPDERVDFSVDYRARDYRSYRTALLDFAAQRHPAWQDRLAADVGVQLVELMSTLGDELAFVQDRIAREATLESAGERRSLRRHAALVDYLVHDGLAAAGWLDVQVKPKVVGDVAIVAGTGAYAISDAAERVDFEVGRSLAAALAGEVHVVRRERNALTPHLYDQDATCLPVGATELHVVGHLAGVLPFDDGLNTATPGKWVMLRTDPSDPAVPARAFPVRLIAISDTEDPLLGTDLTRLTWEQAQALPFQLCLTEARVHANLVPVTAGRTEERWFHIRSTPAPDAGRPAVEREGPDGTIRFRFGLPLTDSLGLGRLGSSEAPGLAEPEIDLREHAWDPVRQALAPRRPWTWRRSLLGAASSLPSQAHYTLDDGIWRTVRRWRRGDRELTHADYATGRGNSVYFGDGEFGRMPPEGAVFQARYRVGNGPRGNVAQDTLVHLDDAVAPALAAQLASVSNPLPISGGLRPETADEVRRLAPEAFSAVTYRAVRPTDYAEAAERLDWVDRAGSALRFTGSWLACFTTPDPRGALSVTPAQRAELAAQLDRFRQAGREVHVRDPRYAPLDLRIEVCAERSAYRGQVKQRVLAALFSAGDGGEKPGFFHPDCFTFGTPLERSALEAAIQAVPGVRAVERVLVRRRGWFDWRLFNELAFAVGVDEVIEVANDPAAPERGAVRLVMRGGA